MSEELPKNTTTKNKSWKKRKLPGLFTLMCLAFFIPFIGLVPRGASATVAGYSAQKTSQSFGNMVLAPGKAITFEVSFKNTGTVAWENGGAHYTSLYADEAGKDFRHKFWFTVEQPGKMIESKIIPGEVAHFRFALQAPEVIGLKTLKLKLAAENLTWIPGGILEVPVNVTTDPAGQADLPGAGSVVAATDNFRAVKLIQSSTAVALPGGGENKFIIGFKNVGQATWQTTGDSAVKICVLPSVATESFRGVNWLATDCPAAISGETPPGQIGYFNFSLVGNLPGTFKPTFAMLAGGVAVGGGAAVLPIIISGTTEVPAIPPAVLEEEPEESVIRVGLYNTATAETIRADKAFEVRDAEDNLIFTVPAGSTVTAEFNFMAKTYTATFSGEKKSGLSYLRFLHGDRNTIFEIMSFENLLSWNKAINNNKFRGNLELRWSEDRGKLYMINELPLETYLAGVAEVSNINPAEYLKAMAIAARTYAQYNINAGGKHPAGNFHLNAGSYDQVYRGYNSELTLPNFVKAVNETRGMVVTYNGEVVVTPYFSQSDGRTRAWEEVWWGTGKPWLVSRPDPNCAGKSLLGHGVGLSARGARVMAENGSTFEEILKHYYTGVEVKNIY